MDIEKRVKSALDDFYTRNHIDKERYLADHRLAREQCKEIDIYIGKDILEDNLHNWISRLDEEMADKLLKLFSKYTYVTQQEMQYLLSILFERIQEEVLKQGGNYSEILFISVEAKYKSGGDNIRSILQAINMNYMTKEQYIASISRIDASIVDKYKYIIFIDDIIGTGFTTYTNIKMTYERFNNIDWKSKKIMLSCLYAREKSINMVRKWCKKELNLDIKSVFFNKLHRCFETGYCFSDEEMVAAKELIASYERLVNENPRIEEKEYFLGFRESKALISFYYETPNNTLCSFWKYSEYGLPIFPRQTQRQPSRLCINDLKKKKEINRLNAYNAGVLINNENV